MFLRYRVWQTEIGNYGSFFALYPPLVKTQKISFEKMKTNAGDIIISHKCTKNHNHMRYSSWDTEWDRQNFLSFWTISWLYTPITIKFLKQWKKHLEMSSLYTCVPKITIIWCMLPEIWNTTDITFCHFGTFFALSPPMDPENQNLE